MKYWVDRVERLCFCRIQLEMDMERLGASTLEMACMKWAADDLDYAFLLSALTQVLHGDAYEMLDIPDGTV